MQLKTIALIGSGLSIIQSILGFSISLFGANIASIVLHIIIAIIILVMSVLALRASFSRTEKNLSLGCLVLAIIQILLGGAVYSFGSPALTIVHFLVALGLVSNFSVIYGMKLVK
ncbi:MAG: hypothetical protein RXR31_01645 [Thermoproteota archaeon]|jgi:hypothetical protein